MQNRNNITLLQKSGGVSKVLAEGCRSDKTQTIIRRPSYIIVEKFKEKFLGGSPRKQTNKQNNKPQTTNICKRERHGELDRWNRKALL